MNFEVLRQDYESLSKDEQAAASNNGSGKEYANYLRVKRYGETVYLENDAMETEDARFSRDLDWIKQAIEYAYQCGVADGKAAIDFSPLKQVSSS